MSEVRWAECSNQDGKHAAWYPMFRREAEEDRCPGRAAKTAPGPKVGTEVQRILDWPIFKMTLGIELCPGCESLAADMNRWGPEGCRERIREILDRMRQHHAEQNVRIPFSETAARTLVEIGIWRAKRRERHE